MAIRALIADDEPAGRSTLRLLLAEDPDVQIVGECRTGADTVDAVLRQRPDLLFLDIQMPGGTGSTSSRSCRPRRCRWWSSSPPTTAIRVQAFEVHAADYLLKPFSDRRFRSALAHAKERLRARPVKHGEPVALPAGVADRLAIRTSDGVLMLATAEIDWIEARGDYARIHRGGRSDLVRESLSSLEGRLGPARFVRIHRSAIVNLARVREFKSGGGGMVAILMDGQRCRLSRRGRERVAGILAIQL